MVDLDLVVTPRASVDRVGPWADGALRVRVSRPPSDGEANRAVVRLVARALDVAPSRVDLVAGDRGRQKRVRIADLEPAELERRLAAIGAD
jgi:uncharacterized protein